MKTPEAHRGKETGSRLLREELTELGFQLRSSDSKAVCAPWCYTELKANFSTRLGIFLGWTDLKKTQKQRAPGCKKTGMDSAALFVLLSWQRLWFLYLLKRSTNTLSVLELTYVLFFTWAWAANPNPETERQVRHKANYIKTHWWLPLVYELNESLPAWHLRYSYDLVPLGLPVFISCHKC